MLQERDVFKLLGNFIASEVQRHSQPILSALDTAQKQIAQLQAKNDALRIRLEELDTHIDERVLEADDVTALIDTAKSDMRENIAAAIYALPKPEPGPPGPPGERGTDGANGADGKSLCLDDIRACLVDLVDKATRNFVLPTHVVSWFIDRDGNLCGANSDGSQFALGRVVGRDGEQGPAGKDGIDGLGIEQIEYDGERTWRLANEKVDKSFVVPTTIYQGLWKSGRSYVRGDEVTTDGSQWIAMRDTDRIPGTIDSGWVLACKRGGAGKPGKDGKDAATAPPNNPAALGKR